MAQTVIGIFDSAAEAQQAVQRLTSRGISGANIDVSNSAAGSSTSTYASDTDEEESGVSRFFKNLFSDDDDTYSKYNNVAKRSQSIVTVHAQSADEAEDVADILDECGAVDVDERAASYGYGTTTAGSNSIGSLTDTSTTDLGSTANIGMTSDSETSKIPIIEENLEVGKKEVLRGGVRLRSRIIERPVEESIRLREENVRVERTPVDRVASASDLANFKETEIQMNETAEVPIVSKEARVVEEISLDKEVSQRTETISDTVRKTEVDVEDLDKSTGSTNTTGF